MTSAWVINSGDLLRPAHAKDKKVIATMDMGTPIQISWDIERSKEHNGGLRAWVREAYHQWPESHRFQPDNEDHLMAWLLVAAKHRHTIPYELASNTSAEKLADYLHQIIQTIGKYAFVTQHNEVLYVFVPKSISFKNCKQSPFNDISARIDAVLQKEIGLSLDDLKSNAGKAA